MSSEQLLYVGTYTEPILFGTGDILQGKGDGIYLFSFDAETGALAPRGLAAQAINPSYLCFSPDREFLYAVSERKEYEGEASGAVNAFRVDRVTGALTPLNARPTGGTDPCHVIVNQTGAHLYVSNFMSGSVCVYPLSADGFIGNSSQLLQHRGSSVVTARQAGPHAHSLVFDRAQTHAFVPDLGIDKLMTYTTDFVSGRLTPAPVPYFSAQSGEGPRYCAFHPNFHFCYLINEIASSISLLYYDEQTGAFERLQTVPTVPDGCAQGNTCADLHLTPDGQYLYGSNRGHDSIAAFRIDQITGMLTPLQMISCGGKTPRNFAIDCTGQYLIVGNQDTDNLLSFRIDSTTGRLTKVFELECPTPVCIKSVLSPAK